MSRVIGEGSRRLPVRARHSSWARLRGVFRRSTAWVAVVALLAGGGVAVTAGLASAAPGPDPKTEITFTKSFDGTGHGTAAASFVNTANGFVPGDDTASDGVVSSGDLVGYELGLRFLPAAARQVSVTFAGTTHLELGADALAQLCQPVPGVTAGVVSGACVFKVSAGVSASVTRTVTASAADTSGAVAGEQRLSVELGVAGQQRYTTVEGDAVSVVSAPLADLTIRPAAASYLWGGDGTGGFVLEPNVLRRAGFSTSKGATAATAWQTRVNVSAFPEGTTWTVDGTVLQASDGWVTVTGDGAKTLAFALPGGKWADLTEGDSETYEVRLEVPETAFGTADYLNNGDGSQPGGGKPKTFATFDAATGAVAGIPFPNNDYSAVTVYRPMPTPGAVFGKQVEYPRDDSVSKFEPGNRFWVNAAQTGISNSGSPAELAPGAQFRQQLSVDSRAVKRAGRPAIAPPVLISDEWDPKLQRVDGLVTVTGPGGAVLDPAKYTLEWSTTVTGDEITDAAASDGWVAQEEAPAGARALRVVFAPDALPVDTDPGAGWVTVTLPSRIREGVTSQDGPLVPDTLRGRIGAEDVVSVPGAVRLVFPTTPTLHLTHTPEPAAVYPGGETTFTVTPTVVNPVIVTDGFTPEAAVTLDRCVTQPVNQTPGWVMTVTDAVAGPSGRVCGDPASTPAILTFTPAQAPMYAQSWNAKTALATLPTITYTAQATQTARTVISNSASFVLTGEPAAGSAMPTPAVADALVGVLAQTSSLAQVTAEPARVQPGEPLNWTVDVASAGAAGFTERVITGARNDDLGMYGAATPTWTGGGSRYTGTFAGAQIGLDGEQTSAGVELFYTRTVPPGLDPAGVTDWAPVAGADPALVAGAAALKVRLPAGAEGANARVTVRLIPVTNAVDEQYVVWAGPAYDQTGAEIAPAPWPRKIDTVLGTVTGTIWNDLDSSGMKQAGEPGYAGVTVGLFNAPNGVAEQTPLTTTTTTTAGGYTFPGVYAGEYVVKITERGANLPAATTSYYGTTATIDPTYSYKGQRLTKAQLASTPFQVGVGGTVSSVDFGFADTHPKVDIDKSAGQVSCNDTTGICDVAWQVTITNLGDTDITAGTLTDTTSDGVYDMEAIYGQIGEPVVDVVDRSGLAGYALTATGKVYSWGMGDHGQNGDGSVEHNLRAAQVQGLPAGITQVIWRGAKYANVPVPVNEESVGGYAISAHGEVYAWGQGTFGANGNGSVRDNLTAEKVRGLPAGVTEVIDRGGRGAFAITADGRLFAWGDGARNGNGNAGTGGCGASGCSNYTAVVVPGVPADVSQVTLKEFGGYALTRSGQVWTWGQGAVDQRGGAGPAVRASELPAGVKKLVGRDPGDTIDGRTNTHFTREGAFVIDADGRVWAVGRGTFGPNGNGSEADNLTFKPVGGLPAGIREVIAARGSTMLAISSTGQLFSWGYWFDGALGRSSGVYGTAAPVEGLPAGNIVRACTSDGSGFALTEEGRLFSWGYSWYGSLGNGLAHGQVAHTAMPVLGISQPVTTMADCYNTPRSAIDVNGTLYAWGSGARGMNGNWAGQDNYVAMPVDGVAGAVKLTQRPNGGYAIGRDGEVYAWGNGQFGAVGDGTGQDRGAAVLVEGLPPRSTTLGTEAVPAKSVTPVADGATRFVKRQYGIDRIPAGGKVEVVVRGKTNQGAAARNVLNQAWFTSPSTPFAGIAKNAATGRAKPILPVDPGASPNPAGIPGNASCDTNVDGQNETTPDSCDQVPVVIPAAKTTPGKIRGIAYVIDTTVKVGDIPLTLFNLSGVKIGETVSHADGSAFEFLNVPSATGYRVVAGVSGAKPTQSVLDQVYGHGHDPAEYSFGFAPFEPARQGCPMIPNASQSGCFDPETSSAGPISVSAGEDRTHVDVALILGSDPLRANKFSDVGDPALLAPNAAGQSDPLVVKMWFKNFGQNAVSDLTLSDTTLNGPSLGNLTCLGPNGAITIGDYLIETASGSKVSLGSLQELSCWGTLPALTAGTPKHHDRVVLNGRVMVTGMLVSASDDFEASLGKRAWELSKTASVERGGQAVPLVNGDTVRPGEQVTYTLTATNTGDVSLTGLVVSDDASQVLNSARLAGSLPAGVSRAGSKLSWLVPAVGPGLSQQVSYTVTVKDDAYGVPLVNTATGDGVVEPTGCGGAQAPCKVTLATPEWFAFPLPVLGGATVQGIVTWGGLIVAVGVLAGVLWRRRRTLAEPVEAEGWGSDRFLSTGSDGFPSTGSGNAPDGPSAGSGGASAG